jgi:hypothetical protein
MSSSQAPYRGAVQAQGSDITKKGGYTRSWAEDKPVTDEEGLSFLDKIEGECSESQQALRKKPFERARRFIELASSQGGVLPEAQPKSFYYRKNDKKYSSIRVDIEIHAGLTFIPVEQVE